jgi:hypothetical protein
MECRKLKSQHGPFLSKMQKSLRNNESQAYSTYLIIYINKIY